MEEWKDVKGYEGFYQVSNEGRVRSIKRWHGQKRDYINSIRNLTLYNNGTGYMKVSLSTKGKYVKKYVHRLVAEAFIEKPAGCDYVNHLDYNRANNNVNNLEWCTAQQNILYSNEKRKKLLDVPAGKSGVRYVHIENKKGRKYYVVCIQRKKYGWFRNIEEAIKKRDEILETKYH